MFENEANYYAQHADIASVIKQVYKDGANYGYSKGRSEAKQIIKNQKELLDRVLSGAETLSDFAQNTLHKAEQFLKEVEE